MCIFCDEGWIYRTICSVCIKDDDKLSIFHLIPNINFKYQINLDEGQINKLIDLYMELKGEKKTQKEIYRIIFEKYKPSEKVMVGNL